MTSLPPVTPARAACYACANEARFDDLPPRELVAHDAHWRVAHSFTSALPGWLVLLPRRHVTAVHELSDTEAATLGGWQVGASRALRAVTGCAKTYVAQFAEADGFAHVHFHVVPRATELPAARRGPGVFELLHRPKRERVTAAQADEIALALRAHL
ncbi:HIT domain-containing protein [Streptomyces sp. NPDC046716]|uniref:HIT family protein n=1 Tax=Streptomyces sp. NPDC046716 TaxID=3157093 RepID=UPI0033C2A324